MQKRLLVLIILIAVIITGIFATPAQAAYVGEYSNTVNVGVSRPSTYMDQGDWGYYSCAPANGYAYTSVPTNKCGYLTAVTLTISGYDANHYIYITI